MHRIAALPGGWEPGLEGVIFVEQNPAPIIFLTAKDTDIQTLSIARQDFPQNFSELRAVNLLQLQQQLTIDTYTDQVLAKAKIIVLRLLGGRAYWSYGLEVVRDLANRLGIHLLVLPGDDRPDLDLMSHSTVSLGICDRTWHYLNEGGVDNIKNAFLNLSDLFLGTHYQPPSPQPIAPWGIYQPIGLKNDRPIQGQVGIIFYRAYYQAANLGVIDTLCQALADRGLGTTAVYVSSLQNPDIQSGIHSHFANQFIDLLLVSTGFSIAKPTQILGADSQPTLWQRLNVPVLQIVFSSGTYEQWQGNQQGLAPRDMAMQIALPEVDGRITTRAIACKSVRIHDPALETETIALEPIPDRLEFVADLAANWVRLRRTSTGDRAIAIVLANYPNRDGRLANGVGLDTPQSCVEFLLALANAGYDLGDRAMLPKTGDELIDRLTRSITNDPEGWTLRTVHQSLSIHDYQSWFLTLPEGVQAAIQQRWGLIADSHSHDPDLVPRIDINGQPAIPIAGLQFGKIFVGIQPSRGYDRDPSLNYHAPDLEPTHDYLA
ncbi:MAG: cobaltochelatase subunit CobN, partial [Oscillatoriales cyanobacterium]